jgi:hypothetical protein
MDDPAVPYVKRTTHALILPRTLNNFYPVSCFSGQWILPRDSSALQLFWIRLNVNNLTK